MVSFGNDKCILKIELSPPTPSQRATFEIEQLRTDERFRPIIVLGGRLSEANQEENTRRKAAYKAAVANIIKKHGVEEEYLKPRRDQIELLRTKIAEEQAWIDAIEAA